ncbi:MAG: outer membrane protein assembly factor [Chitinophagaceae bacterium]|nr:outer membrane protein assembly factor [Chitinophagaceae bacterium]
MRFFYWIIPFLFSTGSFSQDIKEDTPADSSVKRGLIPAIVRQYNRITQADRMLIPFPILTRQPETGWLGGIGFDYYFKPRDSAIAAVTRPSYIYGSFTYSQLRQFQSDLQWQVFTQENKWFLKGQVGFINYYDRFWGIGNETPESNLSEYLFNRTRVQLRALNRVSKYLYVGALWQSDWYTNVDWFNVKEEVNLDSVPGTGDNRLIGLGPAILYDSRDNPYAPFRGFYAEFQTTFFSEMLGSEFGFQRILADVRKFVPLGKKPGHLFAFQTVFNFSIGPEIPFREMGRLGSPMIMRGYFNGRFKDRHMGEIQAEYRFPVWKGIVSGAAFFSTGRVAPTPGELFEGKYHFSYGLGPRVTVNKKQRISLRLDIALNEFGKMEYYARFFEAF